jgi:site-specific DNA recombinase
MDHQLRGEAMTSAFLYARVSSREQEQEGFSIPAQLKLLRDYATRNSLTVEEEFIDVETAKVAGRKQFDRMIQSLGRNRNCRTVLVEKTDRLYRNFRDAVTLEDLDVEVHLVKEGQIISKDARSQAKLIHGMQLVLARNYIENLREEVKKGMREKAEQGIYPGRAPFGYRNNRASRTIEIHPENASAAQRIFEIYATGQYSLLELRAAVRKETGKTFVKSYLNTMLRNPFYVGKFEWGEKTYMGTQPRLITNEVFERVQDILSGRNKRKCRKHDFAFRGLLTCAEDNCTMTAEVQKGKYIYYRCSGYRGKCSTPYFREEEISKKLGEILKNIQVPDDVVRRIEDSFDHDQERIMADSAAQRERHEKRLSAVRRRMDQAYADKLDGKIPEDFWERKMSEWRSEEQQIEIALNTTNDSFAERVLSAKRILELANKAYCLYVTEKPAEQAKLLRKVLSNCSVDALSLYPAYRKPYDSIFERVKTQEWSGREDLNLRPPGPEPDSKPY